MRIHVHATTAHFVILIYKYIYVYTYIHIREHYKQYLTIIGPIIVTLA